jgi:hypothetical protein
MVYGRPITFVLSRSGLVNKSLAVCLGAPTFVVGTTATGVIFGVKPALVNSVMFYSSSGNNL